MRTNFQITFKLSAAFALAMTVFCASNTSEAQSQSRYRFDKPTPKPVVHETIERPAFEDSETSTFENTPRIDEAPPAGQIKPLGQFITGKSAHFHGQLDQLKTESESAMFRHAGAFDSLIKKEQVEPLAPQKQYQQQLVNNETDLNASKNMVRVASIVNEPQPNKYVPDFSTGSTIYDPAPIAQPTIIGFSMPQAVINNAPFQDQFRAFESRAAFQTDSFSSLAPRAYSTSLFGDDCCCDEWNGYCKCKDVDYGCGCGGLKANPGHLGMPWLKGNDPCEGEKRGCLGSGGKSCGSCNSCGSNSDGLLSNISSLFHNPSQRANGCGSCRTKLRDKTDCGCDSCRTKLRGNTRSGCDSCQKSACMTQPEPQPCNGCQIAPQSCRQGNQSCNDCSNGKRRSLLPGGDCGCDNVKTSGCGCKLRQSKAEQCCEPNFFSKSNR